MAPSGHLRNNRSARVRKDGSFRVSAVAPGPGRLFVSVYESDEYGLLDGIEAPLDGVRIRLVKGVTLHGRVVGLKPKAENHGAVLEIRAEQDVDPEEGAITLPAPR